jgi:hypothetical protein
MKDGILVRMMSIAIVTFLFSGAIFVIATDVIVAETSGDYDYHLINGDSEVEITGYHGIGGDIIIPNQVDGIPVISIGDYAFFECKNLTSVTIPASVTSIGSWVFAYWSPLTAINVDPGNANFASVDGVLYNKAITTLIQCPSGWVGEFTILSSVTSIDECGFYECASLTSISIPDQITSIGDHAFYSCTAMSSVIIGNGITSIGAGVFDFCSSLTSVTIPEGVTQIGFAAFDGCSSLTSVTIPTSVTVIGEGAFHSCSSMASVKIPGGVTSIGNGVFGNCTSLTSVIIPENVTQIGFGAFDTCTSLTSVTIPDNVTSIGDYAFSGCSSLTSVTIGKAVTSIGDGSFAYCISLTSVTIPDGVKQVHFMAFASCSSLTAITVDANNTNYASIGGVLYNKATTTLIQCPSGMAGALTIPNNVTSIGDYAFASCTSLTSLTIGNGVTSIGYNSFNSCTSLTSVTLGSNVDSIGDYAFQDCSSLKSMTVPDSVTSIGESAFNRCSSLNSVTIGSGVTSIGWFAFDACNSLISITFTGPNAPTTVGEGWIQNTGVGIKGYAIVTSNFPAPGNDFHGLPMGYGISVPGVPTSISATPGGAQVTVTWRAPANEGGTPITGYKVLRGSNASDLFEIGTTSSGKLSYTDKDVEVGHTYYYVVIAVNVNGDGLMPEPVNATAEESGSEGGSSENTWLYVGIGVFVTAIIGVAAFLLMRRKKQT